MSKQTLPLSEQLGLARVLPNDLVSIIGSYFQIPDCVGCSAIEALLRRFSGLGIKFHDAWGSTQRLMLDGTDVVYTSSKTEFDFFSRTQARVRTKVTTPISRIMELVGPVITPGCRCPKGKPFRSSGLKVYSSDLARRVDHLVKFLNSVDESDEEGDDEGDDEGYQESDTESARVLDDDEKVARAGDSETEVDEEEEEESF